MKLDIKKLLLTGTAIVAVTAFSAGAQAADEFRIDADGNGTFDADENASTAFDWQTNTNGSGAAGEATQSKNVQVNNTGVITIATGDIIGSATSGNAIVAGVDAKTLTLRDLENGAASAVVINGNITKGSVAQLNLTVDHATQDGGDALALDINGNIDLGTGTLTLDSGNAGDSIAVNVSGDLTAAATVLKDDGGAITLTFDGTSAQTVAGTINGETDADGNLVISNAAGVTFTGIIGGTQDMDSITVESNAANSTATFKAAVDATAFTLGGANTGTNTLVLDGSTAGFTITGAINGTATAAENNIISIIGGKNITQGGTAWGGGAGNIDTIAISGTGTKLITGAAITAANTTIGTGALLDLGAHTITSPIANDGTLNFVADGAAVVGAVTGAGTLNATNTGSVRGTTLTQNTINVADTKVLTFGAVDGSGVDATLTASTIKLTAGGGLTLDADANKTLTVNGAITNTVANGGVIVVGADDEVEAYTFNNDIGTSGSKINTFTITDNASATTVNLKGNLFNNGNFVLGTADIVNLTGTTQQISGNITTAADNNGVINVGNGTAATDATFGGLVGVTGTALGGLNVLTGSTATIGKNVFLSNAADGVVTSKIDGTLNLVTTNTGGDLAFTIEGDGAADFNGTVNVSGTTNNASLVSADAMTIDGAFNTALTTTGKTTTLTATSGGLTIGGTANTTLNIGNGVVVNAGGSKVTLGKAGTTVTLNVAPSDTFNSNNGAGLTVINAAGDTVNNVGTLNVTVSTNATYGFDNGDLLTVIDSDANAERGGVATTYAAQIASGAVVLQDTALIDLQDNGSDAQDLKVKVVHNNASSVITNDYGSNTAVALMNINDTTFGTGWGNTGVTGTQGSILNPTGNNELRQARNNLLSAPNAAAATEIAESLAPTVDGGHIVGAMNVSNHTFGMASDRMAALRTGETGMAAGNGMQGHRFWLQGYGATADQGRREGVDGYDADTYGFAVGLDTETLSSNGILGIAFSYGDTEVDSKNANTTNSEIDTYQITLYGDYDLDQATFINGMLAYAWNDVDTTRNNVGGIAGLTARGDFDANQFTAQASVGRDYAYESMTLTPSLLAHWTHYDADGYTETGAGNAGLVVDQDTVNIFELGVGVTATWMYQTASGMDVEPSLHAGYRYDFIGDEVSTTNRFIGGGAAFVAEGPDPAKSSFNVGAGMKLYTTDNWEFTANYDYDFKSDYDAHSGFVRAGVKF